MERIAAAHGRVQSYSPGAANVHCQCNTCFPGSTRVNTTHIHTHSISICSAVLAQLTAKGPNTLQWAALSPQNCPFALGIWTPV